jgi:hypothetical protein
MGPLQHLPDALGYLASRMRDGERLHLSGPDLRGKPAVKSEEKLSHTFHSIWEKSLCVVLK